MSQIRRGGRYDEYLAAGFPIGSGVAVDRGRRGSQFRGEKWSS